MRIVQNLLDFNDGYGIIEIYNLYDLDTVKRRVSAVATWVVHFRIADYFLNILNVSAQEFVTGNVAPDCGYGEKDSMGEFNPPPTVTHWTESGKKKDCRCTDFYIEYLKDRDITDPDYSFYLGYYIHLMTDIMWSKKIYIPTMEKYRNEVSDDAELLKTVKKDWNDLDFKFLSENPEYPVYEMLCSNEDVKDYLPYYAPGQLTVQTRFIADYYKTERDFNREHRFLNENDVNSFIKTTCAAIEKDIREKKLAQFKK